LGSGLCAGVAAGRVCQQHTTTPVGRGCDMHMRDAGHGHHCFAWSVRKAVRCVESRRCEIISLHRELRNNALIITSFRAGKFVIQEHKIPVFVAPDLEGFEVCAQRTENAIGRNIACLPSSTRPRRCELTLVRNVLTRYPR
jgi:hypothetical protein